MRILNIGSKKYTRVVANDEKEFNANHFFVVETVDPKNPTAILAQI